MEKSSHSMLACEGAQQYAKDCKITIQENEDLQTDSSQKAYQVLLCIIITVMYWQLQQYYTAFLLLCIDFPLPVYFTSLHCIALSYAM